VLAGDWSGDLKAEMQQNTVEVDTRICATTSEAGAELVRLRLQAAVAAYARECRLLAAGTHPFSDWHGQDFTSNAVYQQIRRDYRRLADSQNIFGLHIHVAVPAATLYDRVDGDPFISS
jgi:carboxylate-amine ligase